MLRGQDPTEPVDERLRVAAAPGEEPAGGLVDRSDHDPAEERRVDAQQSLVARRLSVPDFGRDHLGELSVQPVPDLLDRLGESHGLDEQKLRRISLLHAGPDEGADAEPCALPVVTTRGGRGVHRRDQSASLLFQEHAAALLLGLEVLVEGRLGGSGGGHYVIDRGGVETAIDEERKRSVQQSLPARFSPGLGRRDSAHHAVSTRRASVR